MQTDPEEPQAASPSRRPRARLEKLPLNPARPACPTSRAPWFHPPTRQRGFVRFCFSLLSGFFAGAKIALRSPQPQKKEETDPSLLQKLGVGGAGDQSHRLAHPLLQTLQRGQLLRILGDPRAAAPPTKQSLCRVLHRALCMSASRKSPSGMSCRKSRSL